eukprot:Sspe_Gene.17299::Locus_6136_Transcript_1_1_Confidence_1.000_Length_3427::g.17299::m.17299/K00556/trmH; tRNA (guanosine-2'-O-)-methyltransferase
MVIESCSNPYNQQAVLRTAEAFGIQHVWVVTPPCVKLPAGEQKRRKKDREGGGSGVTTAVGVTAGCERWLTIRSFETPAQCMKALREDGWTIWASELSPQAVCLDSDEAFHPIPERIAIVMGSETGGVSPEILEGADKRVYLPMYGFAESFNVGVAAALLLQLVLQKVPRRPLPDAEMGVLRKSWVEKLSSNPTTTKSFQDLGYADGSRIAEPLADLRDGRPEATRWVIKKVRKKEEQSRLEKQKRAAD